MCGFNQVANSYELPDILGLVAGRDVVGSLRHPTQVFVVQESKLAVELVPSFVLGFPHSARAPEVQAHGKNPQHETSELVDTARL